MSFGLFKNGVNSTDKRLIKRFTKAGWSLDKISNKLSILPDLITRVIEFQKEGVTKSPIAAPVSAAEAVVEAPAEVADDPAPVKKKATAKAK